MLMNVVETGLKKPDRSLSGLFSVAMVVASICLFCPVWAGAATEDGVKRVISVQEDLTDINRRISKEKILAEQAPLEEKDARNGNIAKLHEIQFILQRLQNTLKKNISLATEEADLHKAIDSGEAYALTEKKPYSLSYYDSLLDEASGVRQEKEILNASLTAAELKLEELGKDLEKAEQTWRRVKEEAEARNGKAFEDDLQYTRARLERDAARAALELEEAEREGYQKEARLTDLKKEIAVRKLETIRTDLTFDPAALDREISRIEKERNELPPRLQSVVDDQKKVDLEWERDRALAIGPATEIALKAVDAWRETYETILRWTEEMTRLYAFQEKLWTYRYALLKGEAAVAEQEIWERDAMEAGQYSRQAIGRLQSRQMTLQSRISALEKDRGDADFMTRKYASHCINALNRTREFEGEYLSTVLTTEQLAGRFLDEIGVRKEKRSLVDKVLAVGSRFKDVWNFELWVIGDSGVTVRKVVTALAVLILGVLIVKWLIRMLAGRLKRTRLQASAAAAVEKLLLYTGIVLVILFALHTVNIPLTAFAFLGGAIAIGVGFGAQNLINNFISGFIIMAERPIRINDTIEMDGKVVRVENIGARCTRVKTPENIHILVPNSSFLEKNIVNWTLSDQRIRDQVAVGVAYGSCVTRVAELLLQAADRTELVLKDPEPYVLFDNFGDNALTFLVFYWVVVGGIVEKRKIASDVRYHINELFAEHGVTIAFPQQDVHMDTLRPLQVQLLPSRRENME